MQEEEDTKNDEMARLDKLLDVPARGEFFGLAVRKLTRQKIIQPSKQKV